MTDTAQFYMVYINRSASSSSAAVEKKMDLSLSWYRINSKLWVLYTTKDADALYTRLRSLAGDDGNLFICKLNTADRQGWMKKAFWNWLREHESKE